MKNQESHSKNKYVKIYFRNLNATDSISTYIRIAKYNIYVITLSLFTLLHIDFNTVFPQMIVCILYVLTLSWRKTSKFALYLVAPYTFYFLSQINIKGKYSQHYGMFLLLILCLMLVQLNAVYKKFRNDINKSELAKCVIVCYTIIMYMLVYNPSELIVLTDVPVVMLNVICYDILYKMRVDPRNKINSNFWFWYFILAYCLTFIVITFNMEVLHTSWVNDKKGYEKWFFKVLDNVYPLS